MDNDELIENMDNLEDDDLASLVKSMDNIKERLGASDKLVETLKDLSLQNRELGDALCEMYELVKNNSIKLPEKFDVEVKNPVDEVTVKNLKDIKIPEPKSEVKISNLGDISDYKKDLLALAQMIGTISKALSEKEIAVNLDRYTNSNRPLSVRLSDGKKFYDAIMQGISQIGSSSGSAIDISTLATSAKQLADNHQVTVSNIASVPVITGYATSAKQDSQIALETTLNSLIDTLQELVQRLAPLAGAINNTASIRVTPLSSVSTAVTGSVTATGGGYITSTQSIAEKAVAGILYPEKMAITNLTAVLANVNNCTGV